MTMQTTISQYAARGIQITRFIILAFLILAVLLSYNALTPLQNLLNITAVAIFGTYTLFFELWSRKKPDSHRLSRFLSYIDIFTVGLAHSGAILDEPEVTSRVLPQAPFYLIYMIFTAAAALNLEKRYHVVRIGLLSTFMVIAAPLLATLNGITISGNPDLMFEPGYYSRNMAISLPLYFITFTIVMHRMTGVFQNLLSESEGEKDKAHKRKDELEDARERMDATASAIRGAVSGMGSFVESFNDVVNLIKDEPYRFIKLVRKFAASRIANCDIPFEVHATAYRGLPSFLLRTLFHSREFVPATVSAQTQKSWDQGSNC